MNHSYLKVSTIIAYTNNVRHMREANKNEKSGSISAS